MKNKQSLNKTKEALLNLQVENKQKLDKMIATKESQNKLMAELNSKENIVLGGTSNHKQLLIKHNKNK